jgi:hypothetical protein
MYLVSDTVSVISDANQIVGSQTGSQRGQTSGDAGRRPATNSPAIWPFRLRQAMSGDGSVASYKRGVTGSNPVAPTRIFRVSVRGHEESVAPVPKAMPGVGGPVLHQQGRLMQTRWSLTPVGLGHGVRRPSGSGQAVVSSARMASLTWP